MSQDPFRGLRVPPPPAELRERTLQAALAAGRSEEPGWLRFAQRPEVRWAWAATVLLLVAAHAGLTLRQASTEASTLASAARQTAARLPSDVVWVRVSPFPMPD